MKGWDNQCGEFVILYPGTALTVTAVEVYLELLCIFKYMPVCKSTSCGKDNPRV